MRCAAVTSGGMQWSYITQPACIPAGEQRSTLYVHQSKGKLHGGLLLAHLHDALWILTETSSYQTPKRSPVFSVGIAAIRHCVVAASHDVPSCSDGSWLAHEGTRGAKNE
jgi:hypothetical protein